MTDHERAHRTVGRPRVPILTIPAIVDAALAIVTEQGVDGLTMSRLAARLHVTPAALYNHVRSKDAILLHVQDRLMDAVDVSGFGREPWPEAMRRWARSYREVMAAQPGLVRQIAVMPIRGAEATTRMYETVAAGLAESGWRQRGIVPAIVAIESFIYGSAYDKTAPEDLFALEDPSAAPVFAAANRAHIEERAPGAAADVAFEVGLDALLISLSEWAGVDWPEGVRRQPACISS